MDDENDDETPIGVTLSPHHTWNMVFDESRRIGTVTAIAALCNFMV
jgi:hypothetical protein